MGTEAISSYTSRVCKVQGQEEDAKDEEDPTDCTRARQKESMCKGPVVCKGLYSHALCWAAYLSVSGMSSSHQPDAWYVLSKIF